MKRRIDRRRFNQQAATTCGALMASSIVGVRSIAGQGQELDENRLVLLGLNALARACEFNYFADGHRGAALISAHFLCADNDFDEESTSRIKELLDLNYSESDLCKPFPEADPDPDAVKKVGEALMEGHEDLREVGHNAIFATLAIKGFRLMPEAATPERVRGVCELIKTIKPWRNIDPDPEVDPPPFTESTAASQYVLQEASNAIDRFVGFGQGFAGHMFTFGQSLVDLAAMGDVEWAENCRTAFRKYVTVTRMGPDADSRRIPDHRRTELRPTDAEYWQKRGDRSVGIGHVFKYPYGYYDLMKRAGQTDMTRTLEAKAYHVF